MKKIQSHLVGIDQGDIVMFSDFESGGDMWTGTGPRERSKRVKFSEKYRTPPTIFCSLSQWDVSNIANARIDIKAERISTTGFDLVFRTWSDTKVARTRVRWVSFGELTYDDEWELY